MKRVFASLSLPDVHHAKNLLATVGIRAWVKNEMLASAIGQLPFTECQPQLAECQSQPMVGQPQLTEF